MINFTPNSLSPSNQSDSSMSPDQFHHRCPFDDEYTPMSPVDPSDQLFIDDFNEYDNLDWDDQARFMA
jgi:hypothetical protein